MNRIDKIFEQRRAQGRAAMIFYVTAGYPDLAATEQAIDALAAGGADIIELGIPFSDPIADGPTIQQASQVALEKGVTVRQILELTARVRAKHPDLGLLFFGAYNPIFRYGDEAFARDAAASGGDGILVPDVPPEEAGDLMAAAQAQGLANVFLVAPTTTPERAEIIAYASTGFIYYISTKGVTGARATLPPDLKEKVMAVKAITEKPVAVGFGVAEPEQVAEIAAFADGVIVGSALIKLIGEASEKGDLYEAVRAFAHRLSDAAADAGKRAINA